MPQQQSILDDTEEFAKSCMRQLMEQGDVIREEGCYYLTEKGKAKALKELDRYRMRPGMYLILQMFFYHQAGLRLE